MEEKFDYSIIDKAIDEYGDAESSLIAILQRIQEVYRFLPAEAFPYLAKKLGVSEARIY